MWPGRRKCRNDSYPSPADGNKKETEMKKIMCLTSIAACLFVAACCKCEVEPLVEENHKLVVPPNFGKKPAQ
jgi:hypothetical protein